MTRWHRSTTIHRIRDHYEVCFPFQHLVPRNGHCFCARLSLNETKGGYDRKPAVMGEESFGGSAMRQCHVIERAAIAHSKVAHML